MMISWTLTRLSLTATLLCALLLGAALLAGATMPMPAHASLFTVNSCTLPCVFDVTPGVTLRNDAMVALERLGLSYSFLSETQSASFTIRESRNMHSTLSLLNFGGRGGITVQALQVYQREAGNELGFLSDFLLAGYHPTRVLSDCQNAQRIYVVFEQPLLLQLAISDQLKPGNQVMMAASASIGAPITPIGGFACATETPWMGFASLWKYQAPS
ncbi:MAG: hypothetical protein ABI835_04805 [Chloroflexota bacterium]